MKSVNVYRDKDNIVRVAVNRDLDNRKSALYINEKRAEEGFQKVLDAVKKASTFRSLNLYYDQIDWYDDEVDVYETPTFSFVKGTGKRKPTVSAHRHGSIPKDWEEVWTLSLNDPKTIGPIETFLTEMRLTLDKKQWDGVRAAMKDSTNHCNLEF